VYIFRFSVTFKYDMILIHFIVLKVVFVLTPLFQKWYK